MTLNAGLLKNHKIVEDFEKIELKHEKSSKIIQNANKKNIDLNSLNPQQTNDPKI